jgi:hypothetical protein
MLPAKLEPTRTLAQLAPQENFWQRHLLSESPGFSDGRGRTGQHRILLGTGRWQPVGLTEGLARHDGPQRNPSTSPWLVPLPVPGRISWRHVRIITS